jgi:ATP-dependent DNA ligase
MPFEKITGLVKSNVNVKDATPLEYHIFYAGKTRDLRKSAIENSMNGAMPTTLYEYFKPYKYLQGVKQKVILNDEDKIFELIDKAVSEGYEGVMLRSHDVWYDFKRGNHLLKAKQSDLSGTVEYTDALVEDIEYGEMVVREGGVEAIEELPVALIVSVSGIDHTMKVGSGFSLDDRRAWKEDESIILQHVIEVEFQGWGAKGRMRFPRYLRVRNDL